MPLWAIALVIVAGCIIAGFLGVASTARGKVPQYSPPGDASAPTIPSPMPLAVFIGDSYTQGVGGGGVQWPALVGQAQGWDVENLGLGGTGYIRTSDVNGCGRAYCANYGEAIDEIVGSPSYILVSGGRNDLGLPIADVSAAADALFGTLRARYPNAEIFAIAPWFDDDPPPTDPADFTAAIQTAALQHGAVFLDTGQPLLGRSDLIAEDGLHPDAAGYQALADAVDAALDPALAP
ncbi:lysophospholipase L1-like esterase [Microbacterium trichothecenolyticum]|uniref:SGNH/GDSL hydrolase family protein n=1 Tax=Microbacterium trichothecenolyticum TaxID=69370 RepID=UPI0028602B47|nr:SGNH/GDSL hydrolase family protein [Microbacterium trichothecenolyticum]MDR7187027.1 lysophospholipase L1-like esterase [Microbacterium trichothecenolyticum]